MDAIQQFQFPSAQPRDTAVAAQQLGELAGQLQKGPGPTTLRLVIVHATLCFVLLLLLMALLQQLQVGGVQGILRRLSWRLRMSSFLTLIPLGDLEELTVGGEDVNLVQRGEGIIGHDHFVSPPIRIHGVVEVFHANVAEFVVAGPRTSITPAA